MVCPSDTTNHEFEQQFDSVFVIESLSGAETQTGTNLFQNSIEPETKKHGLFSEGRVRKCTTKAEFLKHLQEIAEVVRTNAFSPILQLECHGDDQGLQLESKEYISWDDMHAPLLRINRSSMNSLFLCSSMCRGGYALNANYPANITKPCCFWGSVGPEQDTLAANLEQGFADFYSELLSTQDVGAALRALRNQVGDILIVIAEWFFAQGFLSYVDITLDPDTLDQRVEKLVALTGGSKADIRNRLSNPEDLESEFYRLRARHLLIHEYSEIVEQFTLRFPEIFKIDQWKL